MACLLSQVANLSNLYFVGQPYCYALQPEPTTVLWTPNLLQKNLPQPSTPSV
jgi:hypothetical protein